jgi:hypothetical protein
VGLSLKCHEPISKFDFNLNLRRYDAVLQGRQHTTKIPEKTSKKGDKLKLVLWHPGAQRSIMSDCKRRGRLLTTSIWPTLNLLLLLRASV